MKLTYRGISYQSQIAKVQSHDMEAICKYRLSYHSDANKIVLLRQVRYYTYRGVSYTKYPIINAKTKLLLPKQ